MKASKCILYCSIDETVVKSMEIFPLLIDKVANYLQPAICLLWFILTLTIMLIGWDYTMCFSILYYTFLTNSVKFIKVYIIRKGKRNFTRKTKVMLTFHQKSLVLRKSHKKNVFGIFLSKQARKKKIKL